MHQMLLEIIAEKKNEVARLKRAMPDYRYPELPPRRDFKAAVSAPGQINLIAEIKFASPSAGRLRTGADPLPIGKIYQDSGAAAISLLTDKRFFQGDLVWLPRLKQDLSLPILRKDFIVDTVQVQESSGCGADALLLIARILSQNQLAELIAASRELDIACLTEIHGADDLAKAVDAGAEIIGINNRDLDTFRVDINTTFKLAPLVPHDRILISESGIYSKEDIYSLKDTQVQAVLVGSALMQSDDPAGKTAEIVKAGKIEKA